MSERNDRRKDDRHRIEPRGEDFAADTGADLDVADELDDEIDIDEDGGAFHDPVLRRALAHAPDHAVVPMDETRESIRAFAHEAVAPSLPAAPVGARRTFMQRVLGLRGGAGVGSFIPWNVLFAAALVAVVVTVRDRPSTRAPATEVARNEPAMTAPSSPVATPEPAAPTTPASAPESASAQVPQVSAASEPIPAPAQAPVPMAPPTVTAAPPAAASSAPPLSAVPQIGLPVVESPADAAARVLLEQKLQRLEAAEARARLAQQSDTGGSPAANLFAGSLPRTAIPVEVPAAARAGRPGTAPAAATPRAEDSPSPTFTALSQWTRLTITSPGGEARRIARSEARELGPLVGSAALVGVGSQPLSGRVEWRIALERNGEQLGLLEVAGNQVRWKENGVPAGTGAPAANALASLRQALKEAQTEPVKEPVKAADPAAGPATEATAPANAVPDDATPVR